MSTLEEENKIAQSSLDILRQRIEEKKQQQLSLFQNPVVPKLELINVPLVTIEHTSTFSLERHEQLCNKLEALYHNYLVLEQGFPKELKELAIGIEELLTETMNCRI